MLCLGGQLRHPVLGIFQLLIGVLAVRLGLGYLVVRLQDIAGNLVGCRRHLGDGRRHLLGLDILFGDVGARLAGGCFQMHREILQGEGRIVHSSKDGADPGLQQLDVEVCNGTGILPRIDEPGQAVIFVRELSQITGGSDEGVTIDQGQPQEGQQGEQRPPGPHQIGSPRQHQQDTDDGHPVAHRAQAQSALSLPPLHALQSGIGAPGHGFHLRRGATADRLVAIDPPLLEDRGDIGIHPIVTPILAAMLFT
ncbi:hypothetical protein KAM462_01840 [Aeromonas caviae]|nr:hypothetical protein KAM462_01840 [Aeromonas caviae]GKR09731.1 hypothetical protein KAM465_13080 [Aeromonas caviae]GKR47670.1 hypothetical protein KAM474_10880 [Aeromonas caviae]GKR57561.1 hypothetical protein KAM476_24260 [Aeromonas caviae]